MPIKNTPKKFKPDTEQIIVDNYHVKTRKELEQLTGIQLSNADIQFVVKKHNLNNKDNDDIYDITSRKYEFEKLVGEGYTNKQIKEKMNLKCSIALISYYRCKWNLTPSRKFQKLTPNLIKQIKNFYINEKMGSAEIAEKIGVNISTIQTFLREENLLRSAEERSIIGGEKKSGDKHPYWKGGYSVIRPSVEFKWTNKYKESIRHRDNYQCQLCNKSNLQELYNIKRSLCIHHIIPYRVLNDNPPWNLISLCTSCHSSTEQKYSDELIENFNRIPNEQLISTFVSIFRKD